MRSVPLVLVSALLLAGCFDGCGDCSPTWRAQGTDLAVFDSLPRANGTATRYDEWDTTRGYPLSVPAFDARWERYHLAEVSWVETRNGTPLPALHLSLSPPVPGLEELRAWRDESVDEADARAKTDRFLQEATDADHEGRALMVDRLFANPTPMGEATTDEGGRVETRTTAWSYGTHLSARVESQRLFDQFGAGAPVFEPTVQQALVETDNWTFILLFPTRSAMLETSDATLSIQANSHGAFDARLSAAKPMQGTEARTAFERLLAAAGLTGLGVTWTLERA